MDKLFRFYELISYTYHDWKRQKYGNEFQDSGDEYLEAINFAYKNFSEYIGSSDSEIAIYLRERALNMINELKAGVEEEKRKS